MCGVSNRFKLESIDFNLHSNDPKHLTYAIILKN